MNIHI